MMLRLKSILLSSALLVALGCLPYTNTAIAQPHSGSRVDCASCHDCKTPSLEEPCLLPCPRPESATNSINGATQLPDFFILGELSEIYVPVIFPHKLHANMEMMGEGCNVCHHYNPPGPILKCKECHGIPSQPEHLGQPSLKGAYHRQCLGCHREWSHETDCAICHARIDSGVAMKTPEDMTDIIGSLHPNIATPEKWIYRVEDMADDGPIVTFHHKEHIERFGLACVDCHKKENCGRCHDEAAKVEHVREDPHEDCSFCHDVEDDCAHCHKNTESRGFNHAERSGFDLKSYHANLKCVDCHKSIHDLTGLSPECDSCHTEEWSPEEFDHSVTGLKLDENHIEFDCEGCHTEGFASVTACDLCHDDERKYPESMPGVLVTPRFLSEKL
ncbi:MAG: cytochrome c3 family protein [Candidatus Omnitrophica bacterium]|nr:cytochrome c3 family protein [Candidatus Omnitrophota bacterium]MCB9770844.1 cytochrome c3 family protein [Candidatus Omnitrophota bacterium]